MAEAAPIPAGGKISLKYTILIEPLPVPYVRMNRMRLAIMREGLEVHTPIVTPSMPTRLPSSEYW